MIQKIRWSVLGVLLAVAVSVVAQAPIGPVPGGIVGAPVAITPAAGAVGTTTCTNQVLTAIGPSGGTCTTATSAYVDTSIATRVGAGSTVPVTQGGTQLATLTAHNVYVGEGTSAPNPVPGGTNCYLFWTAAASDPTCAVFASMVSAPGDPAGTTSNTYVMMGVAGAITPTATGRVRITICGNWSNSTLADGIFIFPAFGTGTAPANGAAATGTTFGVAQSLTETTAGAANAFCTDYKVTGLVLSTAYWIDLQIHRGAAGTASVRQLTLDASEF